MTDSELAERQRYWFDHLRAAEEGGVTLVFYAAEQWLKTKNLYNWKSWFIKRGLMSPALGSKNFVPVRADVSVRLGKTDGRIVFENLSP